MIDANSPLVKENMIPVNVPAKDPWEQPFEAAAGKGKYQLKCAGDPNNPEERGLHGGARQDGGDTDAQAPGRSRPRKGTTP